MFDEMRKMDFLPATVLGVAVMLITPLLLVFSVLSVVLYVMAVFIEWVLEWVLGKTYYA